MRNAWPSRDRPATSLAGSSRSPNTMAAAGQASTHAGTYSPGRNSRRPTAAARARAACRRPWQKSRGAVVDLGFGAQPFEDAERMAVTRQAGNFARGIVEVAEYDGGSRAGLHAGGHIFAGTQFAAANSRELRPGEY